MTVAVITDSAASLPPDVADRLDVTVVPMWVVIEGQARRETDIDLDDVLADPDKVTTSGPNPGEFEAVIRERMDGDGVVVLTIAGNMSSTFRNARQAAEIWADDSVRVIDTSTAAGAEGLVVMAAAEMAATGADVDRVEAEARRVIDQVRLVAALPSLDHLVRSGRVPGIAGWAGRQLRITPLFEFREGVVRRLRPSRGLDSALDRILEAWSESRPDEPADLRVAALHARSADQAEQLLARVRQVVEPTEDFVGEFSPVMTAHTGEGLIGLAWWWDVTHPG